MKSILLVTVLLVSGLAQAKEVPRGADCPNRNKGKLFQKTTPQGPSAAKLIYDPARTANTAK